MKKTHPLFSKTKTKNKIEQQQRVWSTESLPNFSSHPQSTVFSKFPHLSCSVHYKNPKSAEFSRVFLLQFDYRVTFTTSCDSVCSRALA